MRKIHVFNNLSLDGYFADASGAMDWAHKQDEEWNAFSGENAGGEGELLFGRVTYEMMASFWPTPQAAQMMPEVAAGMNAMRKYVFSRTLASADWQNTTLLSGDLADQARILKSQPGPGLVILGSGSIVSQLTEAGLIDSYQLVICPIVLGSGRTLFETVRANVQLRLVNSRTFQNGNVVLSYERIAGSQ